MTTKKKALTKGKKKPDPKHVCHFCKKDSGNQDDYCYGCKKNICPECSKFTPSGTHNPADHRIRNYTVHYFD